MGTTDTSGKITVGELVFAVDRQFVAYECLCTVCAGTGSIPKDMATEDHLTRSAIDKAEMRLAQTAADGFLNIWDDIEEDEYSAYGDDDEVECPNCEGFGCAEGDHEICFPSDVGWVKDIDLQVSTDTEGLRYEEVDIVINGLAESGITGPDELEKTHQLARFYLKFKKGLFKSLKADEEEEITVADGFVFKTYREACAFALKRNNLVAKLIDNDITPGHIQGFEMEDEVRISLMHKLQIISYVKSCVLTVFPTLQAEVRSGNVTADTVKSSDMKTNKSCEALVALESVVVEEALL